MRKWLVASIVLAAAFALCTAPGWAGTINWKGQSTWTASDFQPLMHTEGSLICPDWNTTDCNPPTDAFYQAQADYVVWLYVRNWAENIQGTVWYQFEGPGWRHSGMLTKDEQTRPAYQAFQFLNKELGEATSIAKVHDYPDLAG